MNKPSMENLALLAESRAGQAAKLAAQAAKSAFLSINLREQGDERGSEEMAEIAGRLFAAARQTCMESSLAATEACASAAGLIGWAKAADDAAREAGECLVSASYAVSAVAALTGAISVPEVMASSRRAGRTDARANPGA